MKFARLVRTLTVPAMSLAFACGNETSSGAPQSDAAVADGFDAGAPDAAEAGDGKGDAPLDVADAPDAPLGAWPPPALKLTKVVDGLARPIFVTAPAGDDRLFVVEKGGRIRIVKGGALLAAPFLDIASLVVDNGTTGEQGLLGMAFAPDYPTSGRFWVNYSDKASGGDTIIAEYARSTDVDVARPDAVRVLFTVKQPYSNHNGGMLAFGADGFLYVGMGDGGSGGDPQGNGQNRQSKLGKMLRVDVDHYPTPPPWNAPNADPQVWDWGLRNPWRFSFDRATGDLYIGDVGQNAWEEIDFQLAGVGWQNFGWNVTEGTHCYKPATGCDTTGITMPIAEYDHPTGAAVVGGYVYRGARIPALQGTYFYGDYATVRVWALQMKAGAVLHQPLDVTDDLQATTLLDGLPSFGEGGDGEIYVVSLGMSRASRAAVYRIEGE